MSECLVKMEKPKSCDDCDIAIKYQRFGTEIQCPFLGWYADYDNCPVLLQLPEEHGRLVDAEEMYKKSEAFCNQCRQGEHDCEKCNYIVAQGYMYKSPTIVPAAPKEENQDDGN